MSVKWIFLVILLLVALSISGCVSTPLEESPSPTLESPPPPTSPPETAAPLTVEPPSVPPTIPPPSRTASVGNLTLHLIDVGEGDALLVQFPNGKAMLVDGGDKEMGDVVVAYLRSVGVSRLDVVVATHTDANHIGGLPAVFRAFEVGLYVSNNISDTTQVYADLQEAVEAEGSQVRVANAGIVGGTGGREIRIDPSVQISVKAPPYPPYHGTRSDRNANSIVLLLDYNDVKILLTGDPEEETGRFLEWDAVDIDILKVGQHGSKYASSDAFLDAFSPEVGLISAGDTNRFGHPHPETLRRLASHGVLVHCTCWGERNNIVVTTDGVTYSVIEALAATVTETLTLQLD